MLDCASVALCRRDWRRWEFRRDNVKHVINIISTLNLRLSWVVNLQIKTVKAMCKIYGTVRTNLIWFYPRSQHDFPEVWSATKNDFRRIRLNLAINYVSALLIPRQYCWVMRP